MKALGDLRSYWDRLRQSPGADGPLVRWGVVVALAILFWAILLDPWYSALQSERTLLAARQQEWARLQALQIHEADWRKAEAAFRSASTQIGMALLQKTTPTAAQAELQRLLQELVNQHHLKLESQHFMPVVEVSDIGRQVSIQLRLVGPTADTYRFLLSLARNTRLLVIEKMKLGRRSQTGQMGLFIQVAGFMPAAA